MKKGKKMPSIELEGHSDAEFTLIDGKIVRVDKQGQDQGPMAMSRGGELTRPGRE